MLSHSLYLALIVSKLTTYISTTLCFKSLSPHAPFLYYCSKTPNGSDCYCPNPSSVFPQQSYQSNSVKTYYIMSMLCLKHSIGALIQSESKLLQWSPYHQVPWYVYDFISYYFPFTQFRPHFPPYHSLNTPNMYLFHGVRFHLPGTLFYQIFSWLIVHICIKYKIDVF